MDNFAQNLRRWRGNRRLSQLALAGEAGVSARHLSFLESGRARPSREMVLRLCETLEVPRVARNELLAAAGFAPLYRRSALDADHMAPVRAGMERILVRHDPYPAVMLDRLWRIEAVNPVAGQLFAAAGMGPGDSLLDFIAGPGQAAGVIENWAEVGHHTLMRLRAESRAAGGIDALDRAAARLARDPLVAGYLPEGPLPPVISTIYRAGGLRLALYSTFVHFGGAEDLTLNDLKIELMFPADEHSRAVLEVMGGPQPGP